MAAIVDTDKSINLDKLAKGLKENLPSYAQPIFLRVMDSVPLTGTFKLKKVDLQKEGYDVTQIKDDVYFLNSKDMKYEKVTKDLFEKIQSGQIKL